MAIATPTQTVALLTKRCLTMDELESHLNNNGIKCYQEDGIESDGTLYKFLRTGLRGQGPDLWINVHHARWPEVIEPHIGTWGDHTFTDGLKRAVQFQVNWKDAAKAVQEHQAVVLVQRFQSPADLCSPTEQMAIAVELARVSLAIGAMPEVVAYFCPGGEVLLPIAMLDEILPASKLTGIPPLDLFTNLRLSWLDDRWVIFETIGNAQLGLPDFEVYADSQQHDLNEIAAWLRRWSLQHFQAEKALQDGSVASGPGGASFDVIYAKDALLAPKRLVIRLIAQDEAKMPGGLPARLRIDRA
ncbi:hypothetical protein C5Y96_13510 [Blastopirellula marina]|uniref:DUF4261 domain-containing protein n=1 Tax=Blastopirellula marina TaxID=124 RepID=A0A2S8FGS9_9BACT|nr:MULTISPECIES: DUF4261 domain-containing protein [Pirellulaceae]PQO31352.1 hypothetical protein C5Y96_13510 [Blastopirellula marina]RCS51746.1 hypothetical protein DTL36_13520 [Bremerella cremea]